MSNTSIRIASADDLDWLIEAHGAVYASEFGFDAQFKTDIAAKVRRFLAQATPFSRIWIGEIDQTRAGSIAISERPVTSAFLNFVLVAPAYRGRGLARALMQTALDHARSNAITDIHLETYSCLTAARSLYAALGFELTESSQDIAAYGRTFDREFWARAV